ncbi:lipoprotein [Campylobacterota bacterium]|nr:lipoprotein [Campylobacterota bacterium]
MRTAVVAIAALILCGCSKTIVYSPSAIEERLGYDDRQESALFWRGDGVAQGEDGEIVGSIKTALKLENGERILGIDDGAVLSADNQGTLKIYGARVSQLTFSDPIAQAATDGKIVASVSRTNACRITDIASGETIFLTQERLSIAVTSRLARPLITPTTVYFPTLDGKLLIVDRAARKIVSEPPVGTEEFFGNLIFLKRVGSRIIAAGTTKIVSFGAATVSKSYAIRAVELLPSGLYLFTQDGEVLRLNELLEPEAQTKIQYARLIAAAEKNGAIFAVEQSGYIVRLENNLKTVTVFELPDRIRSVLLATNDRLYYHNKIIEWRTR